MKKTARDNIRIDNCVVAREESNLIALNAALQKEELLALVQMLGSVVHNGDDRLDLFERVVRILEIWVGFRSLLQNFSDEQGIPGRSKWCFVVRFLVFQDSSCQWALTCKSSEWA